MQKIKRSILERLVLLTKSPIDIDLFLYISQFQNDMGQVSDVYYKDICLKLCICPQSFYNALYRLENYGLIKLTGKHGLFNVEFINNFFYNPIHYKEGYLDLKCKPFFNADFRSLSVEEKKICLKISLNQGVSKSFKLGIEKVREYGNGISEEEALNIIEKLKIFFDIKVKGKNLFSFKLIEVMPGYKDTGLWKYISYKLETMCRDNKICYTLSDMFDVYYLFKSQYKKMTNIINKLIQTAFEKKSLEPRLINYLISN